AVTAPTAGTPDNETVLATEIDDAGDLRRPDWLLCCAILHQFDTQEQPLAADIADDLVPHEGAETIQQIGAGIRGAVGEMFGLHDLYIAQSNRRGDRMTAVRIDLTNLTIQRRIAIEAVKHAVLYYRCGNRHVRTGDALGDGDKIGRHAIMLKPEHLAGTAEAVDHLIDVQQDTVFAAEGLDLRQIFVRRHGDTDAAHDRLDDHFGHGLRSLAEDRILHVFHAGKAATGIAQAERAAIAVRLRDMHEVARERLELCLALT